MDKCYFDKHSRNTRNTRLGLKVQCNIVNVVALNVSPEVDQVVRWSRPLLDPPNVNDMNPTLASAVIELDRKVRNDLLKAPTY